MKKYFVEKRLFEKDKVDFIRLFFDNGEYIPFGKKELADISVKLYDRLIVYNDDLCAVVESGTIRCKVGKRAACTYNNALVCDPKAYAKDRVRYCLDRCAQGGIRYCMLFDENNWHMTLHGTVVAETDGDFLTLRFVPIPGFGSADGDMHTVCMNDIKKKIVHSICIDFENCDSYTVYDNEIEEMKIELHDKLDHIAHDYSRSIKSGYLRIRFDKSIYYRECNLYTRDRTETVSVKKLKKRLYGKDGMGAHDICHLYVRYRYAGFGYEREECLGIRQIYDDSEVRRQCELGEDDDIEAIDAYFGGYAQKLEDGSVLVTFGENAKNLLRVQSKRMNKIYKDTNR